ACPICALLYENPQLRPRRSAFSPVTKVRCPSVRRQPRHFDLYILGVRIPRLILFLFLAALAQATVVSISTTSLPNGTVGQHYAVAVKAINGCTPYRWWISGTLPSGLVASPSPATTYDLVHGTPAMVGSSTFSVTVKGCGGHISSRWYTVSIAPAQTAHSVSLKWQRSATAVSYDLYRSTLSGGPYGLVASAILGTSFVDQAVTAGETYFYVATAWDGTKESGFSNQVIAVVP